MRKVLDRYSSGQLLEIIAACNSIVRERKEKKRKEERDKGLERLFG